MGPRRRIERPREAKMEPKWSQDDARKGQEEPRGAKRGQDEAEMGPNWGQEGEERGQERPRWSQNGAKMTPGEAKRSQEEPREARVKNVPPESIRFGPQNWPQNQSKRSSKWGPFLEPFLVQFWVTFGGLSGAIWARRLARERSGGA